MLTLIIGTLVGILIGYLVVKKSERWGADGVILGGGVCFILSIIISMVPSMFIEHPVEIQSESRVELVSMNNDTYLSGNMLNLSDDSHFTYYYEHNDEIFF